MWASLLQCIPESHLSTWFGWLTFLAIFLPLFGGICGLAAWKIGGRISGLKDASDKKMIDELTTTLTITRSELRRTQRAAQDAGDLAVTLQKKLAPWSLTQEQKDKFSQILKDAAKGKVAVEHVGSDGKMSLDFAVQVKGLLEAAGYDVWGYIPSSWQPNEVSLVGVQIQVKSQRSELVGLHLQRAFHAIGIEAEEVHRTSTSYEDDFVIILIGAKP
jgi:hypothetical protein